MVWRVFSSPLVLLQSPYIGGCSYVLGLTKTSHLRQHQEANGCVTAGDAIGASWV